MDKAYITPCDLGISWTFFFGPSREAFRAHLPLDEGMWARGRGWALWKSLVVHAAARRQSPNEVHGAGLSFGWRHSACSVIEDLLAEQRPH